MGSDYLSGKAAACEKAWNRGRNELLQPDLLDRRLETLSRSVTAEMTPDSVVQQGDHLWVRSHNGELKYYKEKELVAVSKAPSGDVYKAIESDCGFADATVSTVHPTSRKIEIELKS